MVAVVVIDEFNGVGETESPDIANLNVGSIDASELTPAGNEIVAGENAFEKWIKMAVTGTLNSVSVLKVWISAGAKVTGETIDTNCREAAYGGAETYVQPTDVTSTVATETMPETEPSGANLGIGGSLGGSFVNDTPGDSDYCVIQDQTTGSTPAGDFNTKTYTFQWDET